MANQGSNRSRWSQEEEGWGFHFGSGSSPDVRNRTYNWAEGSRPEGSSFSFSSEFTGGAQSGGFGFGWGSSSPVGSSDATFGSGSGSGGGVNFNGVYRYW